MANAQSHMVIIFGMQSSAPTYIIGAGAFPGLNVSSAIVRGDDNNMSIY